MSAQPQQNGGPPPGMQAQRVAPVGPQKNPVAIALANALRYNKDLKQRQGIHTMSKEKHDFFRYKRFLRALDSKDYAKLRKKVPQLPEVNGNVEIQQKLFVLLIQNQVLQPVTKLSTKEAKALGIKVEKTIPAIKPIQQAVLQPNEYYMWTFTPPNPYLWIYSILGLGAVCYV
ncbi:unnamed protein product [Ambrosiozyma monospora]|uniref:Translocation protein SEC62 n=1 Tax=Ambrosiozyma monospora TaxID=43982 RepID=A0A9W6YX30_AMBMO|nr:unnamed protein product [Ambrosiozyma monospora]